MCHSGDYEILEIRHDAVEGLSLVGRESRKPVGHLPGRDPRHDRVFLDVLQVVRHPINDPVTVLSELLKLHCLRPIPLPRPAA